MILFEFVFLDELDLECDPFSIARYILVRGGDPEDYEIIKPTLPHKKKRHKRDGDKFNGPIWVQETGRTQQKFARVLPIYPIPSHIQKMMSDKKEAMRLMDAMYHGQAGGRRRGSNKNENVDYLKYLATKNYLQCFQQLLWMEETQMKGKFRTQKHQWIAYPSNRTHKLCYLFGPYFY